MSSPASAPDRAAGAGGLRPYLPVFVLGCLSLVFLVGLADLAWGAMFGLRVRLWDVTAYRGAILPLRSPVLTAFMAAFTHLGDFAVASAVVVACTALLWLLKRRAAALFLFGITASAALANTGLKDLVGRTRPPAMLAAVPLPHSWSFPSGHALIGLTLGGALAIIVMLEFGVPRAIVPATLLIAVGALLGISRVYLGVHWMSDVFGGWLMALAWLTAWSAGWIWLLIRAERRHAAEREHVPSERPGIPALRRTSGLTGPLQRANM